MTHYHLFIQSKPHTPQALAALDFVRQLNPASDKMIQVYFYAEGVFHAVDETAAKAWRALTPHLKICQTYLEALQLKPLSGFESTGLVDFFAKHWQDQGKLVQF